jgi:hypothetical protein
MRPLLLALPLIGCSESPFVSRFDFDAEGWTIVGDAQADASEPDFDDGIICAKDDVAGGVWFFHAPPKFLGDRTDALGSEIAFEIKVTEISDPFDDIDVLIAGGGKTLVFDTSDDPAQEFSQYAIPLTAAGWRIDTIDGAAASEADLQGVLQSLETFRIRGEFNTGPDTGCLDNVDFGSP